MCSRCSVDVGVQMTRTLVVPLHPPHHPGSSRGAPSPSRKPRLPLAFPPQLCSISWCPSLPCERGSDLDHVEMHSTGLLEGPVHDEWLTDSSLHICRSAPASSPPGPDCAVPYVTICRDNPVFQFMERLLNPNTPTLDGVLSTMVPLSLAPSWLLCQESPRTANSTPHRSHLSRDTHAKPFHLIHVSRHLA